ncbi:small GTP-binding protein [Oikeobacillus pervagus]|uniref:Small GTP-binding protein n=1 Tax=Oikeobacillus pervagus TaxID=1325931 RepID=A0AAJ1WHS5_9BACI|nr:dynamin family protein [Oikeobacillus pervagus]MDQ0213633.1 small GTP-binding protein [Oikeobacillus pervagus]
MAKTVQHQSLETIIARTVHLYERFSSFGDEERAKKAKLFLKKLYEKEFIVAFCGHFSAGKSTMINELTGEKLLPSSPIPTSANLVKIHHANEDFAKVYYKTKSPLLFRAPYRFEKVKEFCKNGDEVEAIEIGHQHSNLPNEVTVMDTPGVDSTDDAHRISTESALHLADMVFYVMDYNHVQSELNFIYTKDLLSHGVKLYLIINQIDKHREEELSFKEFKESVYKSFETWNVEPEAFFFTSLKEPQMADNDFHQVQKLIHESMNNREELAFQSAITMMNRLISEHIQWLETENDEKRQQNLSILGTEFDEELIFSKELQVQEEREKRDPNYLLSPFETDRETILKNAYLMPATTRDLARQYLESVQSDFKVGLLFSKKKTEEERKRRLHVLLTDLQEKVQSQLEWHLRQLFSQWMKKANIMDDELQIAAEELSVPVDEQLLYNTVKHGARVTGDYVLHYCDDVANQLKKIAISITNQMKEQVIEKIMIRFHSEEKQLMEKWKIWHEKAEAIRSMENLDKIENTRKKELQTIIENDDVTIPPPFQNLISEWEYESEMVEIYKEDEDQAEQQKGEKEDVIQEKSAVEIEYDDSISVEKTTAKLHFMAERLEGVPGFSRFITGLKNKAERLEKREYTIALFGAFSAGKSSFANAMLGEKVLPVSPNPTTAAVNRIHPPNEQFAHRTAAVHFKTSEQMLSDVQGSLELFSESVQSLQEAYSKIPSILNNHNGEGKEKIHLSFLKAFYDGFSQYGTELGSTLTVDLDEFRGFVANEKQSCFVESIDLYYDCDFTREGVTLVDTPGADSINARHTGVAFEYIKNSDAILFVTYYNHAFSKADREFLIQLGRVKDAFELDKMFFLVNAIDLASNEEEVNEVISYVKDQLLQYGIRFPRIHGVSSLLAMEEQKQNITDGPSNIGKFKLAFGQFIEGELTKMAVQTAEAEWERGLKRLQQLIHTAKENRNSRAEKLAEWVQQEQEIAACIEQEQPNLLQKRLSQEVDELVFYVKQRVFYRFSDFFKEAFNPAMFQGNYNVKTTLSEALHELLHSVGYDFAQELRATSLRTENHVHQLLTDKYEQLQTHYQSIQDQLVFSSFELSSEETPEFPVAFQEEPETTFASTLSLFKNAKSFFEKNEKQVMRDQLEEILSRLADDYLLKEKNKLFDWAMEELQQQFTKMKEQLFTDCSEQFTSWKEVLDSVENIDEWEEILTSIQKNR